MCSKDTPVVTLKSRTPLDENRISAPTVLCVPGAKSVKMFEENPRDLRF